MYHRPTTMIVHCVSVIWTAAINILSVCFIGAICLRRSSSSCPSPIKHLIQQLTRVWRLSGGDPGSSSRKEEIWRKPLKAKENNIRFYDLLKCQFFFFFFFSDRSGGGGGAHNTVLIILCLESTLVCVGDVLPLNNWWYRIAGYVWCILLFTWWLQVCRETRTVMY